MDLLRSQQDKSKLPCGYVQSILRTDYMVYLLCKDLYIVGFYKPRSKSILSQTSIQLALVRLFYHIERRPFLYIQASKYNSWYEEVMYCELHILHYLHKAELLCMDFYIHDQYRLVCLGTLYLPYNLDLVEEVLEYKLFHMGFQYIQADKYKFLCGFLVCSLRIVRSHKDRRTSRFGK